jgi:hypothetical protein
MLDLQIFLLFFILILFHFYYNSQNPFKLFFIFQNFKYFYNFIIIKSSFNIK